MEQSTLARAHQILDQVLEGVASDSDPYALLGPAPDGALQRLLNDALRQDFGLSASVRVRVFPHDASLYLTLNADELHEESTLSLPTTVRDILLEARV